MIARFVVNSDGGMLIGAISKNQTLLKPDTVYQIDNYLGEMVISEVGQSIIPVNNHDETEGKTFEFGTWGSRIDHIIECAGNNILISIKEYTELIERE